MDEVERFNADTSNNPLDLQIEVARYLPIRNLSKGARILDLGCGLGFSSDLLLQWGASEVIGIDASDIAISEAQKRFKQSNLQFLHGYAEQVEELVDLSDFDGVCFVECIEHVIDPGIVLNSLGKALRQGAWIYITAPNDYWNFRYENLDNEFHLRKFTKKDFLDLTSSALGNPNESGDCHSFIGFSTRKDELHSKEKIIYDVELESVSIDTGLNSNDSIFYYALWGNSQLKDVIIGSSYPIDIYTKLSDWSKLELNVPDLDNFHIRELSYKLQSTQEQLVEAQNELRAISILVNSLLAGEPTNLILKLKSHFTRRNLNASTLRNVISSPPQLILAIYRVLPSSQKEILRNLRRRLMK